MGGRFSKSKKSRASSSAAAPAATTAAVPADAPAAAPVIETAAVATTAPVTSITTTQTTVVTVPVVKTEGGAATTVIQVPKAQHHVIIGKGGATIKDIKAQSGAQIDLSKDNDDVTVTGTSDAVAKAVALIHQTVGKAESDRQQKHEATVAAHEAHSAAYEAIYAKYQTQIDALAKERTQFSEQADAAYNSGDKGAAAEFREKAKGNTAKMEELQNQACKEVFAFNNKDHDEMTIDLHGLHVEPALRLMQERMQSVKSKGKSPLVVIYGAGNHSDAGGAKIKPAVRKHLDSEGIQYTEINNGSISVAL
ncbi:small MutS related family protein [Planoprotostelium fungivorum]|uniref:Small MutS related family protein n=1 Tax=Planoprotostelium fungivorum TaxID=1890364 RepID=A0A2P6NWL4_9EUKA|nr:small MutS related family protein [Planoprotostelium fungivorum]